MNTYSMLCSQIKATISQCPFTSGIHSALTLSPSSLIPTVVRWFGDVLFGWGSHSVTMPVVAHPGQCESMWWTAFGKRC